MENTFTPQLVGMPERPDLVYAFRGFAREDGKPNYYVSLGRNDDLLIDNGYGIEGLQNTGLELNKAAGEGYVFLVNRVPPKFIKESLRVRCNGDDAMIRTPLTPSDLSTIWRFRAKKPHSEKGLKIAA